MTDMNQQILEEAKALQKELIEIRRKLHQTPELGFDLVFTQPFVIEKLKEYGYEPVKCGKAGVVATVGNAKGKTFLLRGDMDALPIKEETNLSFQSKNGQMHACGHDVHTTMLLGAAKLLKQHEDELEGTVKLMFQPAEEILEGAKDMIESGLLENPKVDAGLMIHIMPGLPMADGTVVIANTGKSLSSSDNFEIVIHGKSGHGSMPNQAIDPILAASNIHLALMEIQSREIPADALVALTIGQFNAGAAANVIPDKAVLRGTLRTFDEELRLTIKDRMKEIVEHISKAYRCKGELRFISGCPALENASSVVELAKNVLPEVIGADKVFSLDDMPNQPRQMGSEDFAYVSQEIPTVLLGLASNDGRESEAYPVHHPKMMVNEEIIPYGVAAHVSMAINWLKDNQ